MLAADALKYTAGWGKRDNGPMRTVCKIWPAAGKRGFFPQVFLGNELDVVKSKKQ